MSGSEQEMQARRRTLLVLQDEMRRVMDACRVLTETLEAHAKGDRATLTSSLDKIRKAEEDVVMLRRALVRELAEIGTLLVNREDLLRTAFAVEVIVGHINGIAFKISQLNRSMVKQKKQRESLQFLIGNLVDAISKLNEGVRALAMNPDQAIEMAAQVQKLESEIDQTYRDQVAATIKSARNYKDLITMKDVLEAIENCSDATLAGADATTILSLGL